MGILQTHFTSMIESLSHSEKHVFYYLDDHPELIASNTLTELAQILNTSNTTIIRMTKRLGLSGFAEFKFLLEGLLKETHVIQEKNLLNQYNLFFQNLVNMIDISDLEFMADRINHSNILYIIGVGLTKPIAEYTAKRLMQLNKSVIYIYESHMIDLLPNLITSKDTVLFLSMSGETKTLVSAAGKLKYTGAALLAITNNGNSSLVKKMHRSLCSGVPVNMYKNYDITSRTFLMIQADLLIELYLRTVV
ncbi:MurR/RpiR family transcriptional regulator [Lacrimispora sp.]|uniref:MurR/RpiR family transcriptional regulator n=1 Tax=Lacrimispora sp. TaxID=2719234 RepID=UPI0028A627FA|nr:MurR/RpiR family transcriptional regulator [Lacrimispora sp.]